MISLLYVDDEADLLELGKHFLEKTGQFSVTTYTSAPDALASLKSVYYDAIIADYRMPGMNGIEFLQAIRESGRSTPFVIFSGKGDQDTAILALNAGADYYLKKGGETISLFAELGEVVRMRVLRRQAILDLSDQEQRYHDIQNANDLIQSVTPDGRFLFVNNTWLKTLEYQDSEVQELTIFDIIHEESLGHCRETFGKVIAGEDAGIINATFKTRTGRKVFVEGIASCRMAQGKPLYIRGIFKDVTERKHAEEALFRANEKLNILSAITRHDILNQLNVLLGYLGMAKEDAREPELVDFLEKVEHSALTIQRQIEFTRAYQDIGVKAPEWINVARTIDAAFGQLHPLGITLENSINGLEIYVDSLVEKVFYNLIENSIRHGEHVTTVRVSAVETGSSLIVRYQDDGVGILDADKGKLFLKEFGKNTGLGLFLSREILSITGITITENGEPEKGARFEIMVPKGSYRSVAS